METYKIVHETWLTQLVSSFGDSALVSIMGTIHDSGLYKVLILGSATLAFISLAWGIHQKTFSKKTLFFFISFAFLTPTHSGPAGYVIVNAVSQACANVLETAVNKIVSNPEGTNLPPGMVLEMITSAASSKIENPEARALLQGFVVNCLPNALTTKGERASFDDLFEFETTYKSDVSGRTIPSFLDTKLDHTALANDNSYSNFRPGKNCAHGLHDMREALASDQKDKPLFLTDRVIGGKKGDPTREFTTEPWFKNWEKSESKLKHLSMNLKLAHAAAYEKSKLISEHGWSLNDIDGTWWKGTNTDASLREAIIGMDDNTTEFGYRFADFKNIISNVSENRWAFTLGAAIKDLKERIELVPYHIASIQLLLKIVCPIFLLTLFLQTFRFFFIWSGAWFAALLLPSIISASRAIHNSIILSKLGIANMANKGGPNALAYGVDLGIAKNLLNDFVPLAYSMIEQEMMIIQVLSGTLIAGAWIAGGGANGFVSWLSNSIQGTLTGSAIQAGIQTGGRIVSGAVSKMGKMAGGPSNVAGSAANSILNSLRSPSKQSEASFKKLFVRKK